MRDIETLVLTTIHSALVNITGISSGLIFGRIPDFEYIKKVNSSSQPSGNVDLFPSIGMTYFDKVRYSPNTYGDSTLIENNDGTSVLYQPQGEVSFPISIYLYTDSSREQRLIGNMIMAAFAEGPYYFLINDDIDDEYLSIEYIGFHDLMAHEPYIRCIDIKATARTLTEVSGYTTSYFDLTLQARTNSLTANINEEDEFSYFMQNPPSEIDPDIIYFQDWNIIPVDLDGDGIFERVYDTEDDVGP